MSNKAAERLRKRMADPFSRANLVDFNKEFDAALAAERRATVERIRAALPMARLATGPGALAAYKVDRILDAEAE